MRAIMLAGVLGLCGWALALAVPAQALVLKLEEWSGPGPRPLGGWSYNTIEAVGKPTIDCSMPASPSGGCALKFTYDAGTYPSSMNGGRASYGPIAGTPTDLYIGMWHRYSSNFVPHPSGWKAEFFILQGSPNNVSIGYNGSAMSINPQFTGIDNPPYFQNVNTWNFSAHRNEWHWFEKRIRLGTPGVCNDLVQVWIDDVLYMDHSNVCFRPASNTAGFGGMQHTSEYGGGGSVISATQYWWVDHTVISTTRIGRPGPLPDTTPPAIPSNFQVN